VRVLLDEFFADVFLKALKILKISESDNEGLRLTGEVHLNSHFLVLTFEMGGNLGLLIIHHEKYQVKSINYQE
jgi:hypothetical protein